MNRQIVCRECGQRLLAKPLTKEDIATGMSVNGRFEAMTDLHCDYCNEVITREVCIAATHWRPEKQPEPDDWESLYGNIIPAATVAAADKLSKS